LSIPLIDITFSVLGKGSADYSFPQNEYTIMICIFQREKRKLQYTYTDLQPLLMKLLIPHHYQPIRKEVMCAKVANFSKQEKVFDSTLKGMSVIDRPPLKELAKY